MVGIYQKLRVNYGLEVDSTDFGDPNPEARRLMEIFAQQYLGSSLHMPYAAYVYNATNNYDAFHRMLRTASCDLGALTSRYLTETEAPPMVSVGLREDGFALLYSDRCASPWCNTPREQMNFFHQNGVLAIYGLYVKGNIGNEVAAATLIQQAFPSMQAFIQNKQLGIHWDDFSAPDTNWADMTSDTLFLGRVVPISYVIGISYRWRYTLIFAIIGIGEPFSNLVWTMP